MEEPLPENRIVRLNGNSHSENGNGAPLAQPVDEDDELIETAKEMGLAVLPGQTMRMLQKVGMEATNIGLVDVVRGHLICTATALSEGQQEALAIMKESKSAKMKLNAGLVLAALAKASIACGPAVNANGVAAKPTASQKKFVIVKPQVPIAQNGA